MVRWLVVLLAVLCAGCAVAPAPPPAPSVPQESSPKGYLDGVQPVPVAVSVPSIKARGDLIPLGRDKAGGWAEPPVEKPQLGSWYTDGPRPGAQGPSVILGHINGNGKPGLFAQLAAVSPGAEIVVSRKDGSRLLYRAYLVQTAIKTKFPVDQVFSDTKISELRLITCGGEYDSKNRRYLSNVIVYAKFVSVARA